MHRSVDCIERVLAEIWVRTGETGDTGWTNCFGREGITGGHEAHGTKI